MKTWSVPMMQLVDVLQLQLDNGPTVLTVTGNSMYPTFQHRRDSVNLVKGEPRKYDVILYKRDNGAYVLHRVIKTGQIYTCCGDNQWKTEPVRPDQIIAVAEGFTRKGKYSSVQARPYRVWVWFWVGVRPFRRPILALRRWLGKLQRKLRRKENEE